MAFTGGGTTILDRAKPKPLTAADKAFQISKTKSTAQSVFDNVFGALKLPVALTTGIIQAARTGGTRSFKEVPKTQEEISNTRGFQIEQEITRKLSSGEQLTRSEATGAPIFSKTKDIPIGEVRTKDRGFIGSIVDKVNREISEPYLFSTQFGLAGEFLDPTIIGKVPLVAGLSLVKNSGKAAAREIAAIVGKKKIVPSVSDLVLVDTEKNIATKLTPNEAKLAQLNIKKYKNIQIRVGKDLASAGQEVATKAGRFEGVTTRTLEKRLDELDDIYFKSEAKKTKVSSKIDREFGRLEKELMQREFDNILLAPPNKVKGRLEDLFNRLQADKPVFADKSEIKRALKVWDNYHLNPETLTDATIIKDFEIAVSGNRFMTNLDEALLLRGSLNLASKRGISLNMLIDAATKTFIRDGFDKKTALDVIQGKVIKIFSQAKKGGIKVVDNATFTQTSQNGAAAVNDISKTIREVGASVKPTMEVIETSRPEIMDSIRTANRHVGSPSAKFGMSNASLRTRAVETIKKQSRKLGEEEAEITDELIDAFILRKEGIITEKESIERASKLRVTFEDVLNLPKRTILTGEQGDAVRQVVKELSDESAKLSQLQEASKLNNSPIGKAKTADLTQALQEVNAKLIKAKVVLLGVNSESGRALQAAKKNVEAIDKRVRAFYNRIKNLSKDTQTAMIDELSKIDINNNRDFLKIMDKLNNSSWIEKFVEYATAAKLYAFTTHAVNVAGTALRTTMDIAASIISNPAAAKFTILGAKKGLANGLNKGLRALTNEGYARTLSKYVEEGGHTSAIKGKTGEAVRFSFRLLTAEDEVFKSIGYTSQLYTDAATIAKAEGKTGRELSKRVEDLVNAPTDAMRNNAIETSKKVTFQEDLGEGAKWLERGRNPANFISTSAKLGAGLFKLFVPFFKTPLNLTKQAINLSPFGLFRILKSGKPLSHPANRKAIAEMTIATGLTSVAYDTFLGGRLTGAAPKNKSDREQFFREGKLPYSVKVGDTWYQYSRVDPFAIQIGLLADVLQHQKEGGEFDIGKMTYLITKQLSDKTYLRGVGDFMKMFEGEEWEKNAIRNNMVVGLIPSFIGSMARAIDPKYRQATTLEGKLKAAIPFLSMGLPEKYDVLGDPLERPNKNWEYFFNPIQNKASSVDPVTLELGAIDMRIPIISQKMTINKVSYKMNDAVYAEFTKAMGTDLKDRLNDKVTQKGWDSKPDKAKKIVIDKIREFVRKKHKAKFKKRIIDTSEKL